METLHLTESQIIEIVRQAKAGGTVSELSKKYGVTSATVEKWCAQYSDACPRFKTRTAKELAGILHKPGRSAIPIEDMQVTAPDQPEHSFKS